MVETDHTLSIDVAVDNANRFAALCRAVAALQAYKETVPSPALFRPFVPPWHAFYATRRQRRPGRAVFDDQALARFWWPTWRQRHSYHA
jgi:hypothetical protein